MIINKFERKFLKYLVPQRTRLLTEYKLSDTSSDLEILTAVNKLVETDYNMIKEYLPLISKRTKHILDIGCGLGLIDIALYKHYNMKTRLFLIDTTAEIKSDENLSGFKLNYKFYNSLSYAWELLVSNQVDSNYIDEFDACEYDVTKALYPYEYYFDVIISLLSCGWHYPIETYYELINRTLKPNGILILDIRHNTGELEYALKKFKLINVITNYAESKHTGGTIGDRYVFQKNTDNK